MIIFIIIIKCFDNVLIHERDHHGRSKIYVVNGMVLMLYHEMLRIIMINLEILIVIDDLADLRKVAVRPGCIVSSDLSPPCSQS